mmetsp:Transcript_11661/g.14133  ORF Transcript_11661/g.14133 Transcript_11661/m.14133 type:complete len:116 (-) Transcript_11661:58-405(-)
MDFFDLFLSLTSVVLVAILGDFNSTLAAAGATAPITSSIAIVLFDRQHQRKVDTRTVIGQQHLVDISTKVIKGVFASLIFAVCFNLLARKGFSLTPCMLYSYCAWTTTWIMLQVI